MLTIYNTLTRRKETFTPIEPGKVRMYVCGMTVYDYCHLGHARVMVVFDMVVRYFRYLGYEVTYVRNVTDIDDKIIRRAKDNGEPITALTEYFIKCMHEDERALGLLLPHDQKEPPATDYIDHMVDQKEPRATDYIDNMVDMVKKLVERGYAYVGGNGDVFYAVSQFPNYGRLSGKNIDELRSGERVDVDEAKRDPLDFVLWKMAKPGEPAWESPWGLGRPGWHIECSAMSTACLGRHFDIHGGGMDLQFPHHENEIAQSEGATGEKFVNLWMHNGFVRVNEEKMSKSLGNFFTVREVLERYDRPDIVRMLILSSHYRSPLNYSEDQLEKAKADLIGLYGALNYLEGGKESELGMPFRQRFECAMNDDFNTPAALAELFALSTEINRHNLVLGNPVAATELAATLKALGGILGILQANPGEWLQGLTHATALTHPPMAGARAGDRSDSDLIRGKETIERKIQERLEARKQKNWPEADRIRNELKEKGIILEDGRGGTTTWRRE